MVNNKTLGFILIAGGITQSFFLLVFTQAIKTSTKMYSEISVDLPAPTVALLQILPLLQMLGILFIIYNFFIAYKLIKGNEVTKYRRIGQIIGLVSIAALSLVVPFFILSIVLPIYKLTSGF
jgi:hypothetical protein